MTRPTPAGHPRFYQTWSVTAPLSTHWRPATCAEADCPAYQYGWVTILPVGHDLEPVIRGCGRRYHEYRGVIPADINRLLLADPDATDRELGAGLVAYCFEAGQTCFEAASHRVKLERPEFYVRRDGDWRAHLGNRRMYDRPDQWVDDLDTRFDQIR